MCHILSMQIGHLIFTLPMKKRGSREGTNSDQSCTAGEKQSWDSNPGSSGCKATVLKAVHSDSAEFIWEGAVYTGPVSWV